MFDKTNNYSKAYNNIKFNSVGGTIQKSHANSFFKSFHQDSRLADSIFCGDPELAGKKVIVLQAMLTGYEKSNLLVELVFEEDFIEKDGERCMI